MTLCIIGGDERMGLLPRFLAEKCLAAQPQVTSRDELYGYFEDLILRSDAVILPIPLTRDGKALFAPHFSATVELGRLLGICAAANKPVFTGSAPEWVMQKYDNVTDYGKSERFLRKNARLTAEGTLSQMIAKSDGTLYGSNILIVGGGRIARELYRLLKPFTDDITVAARRAEVRGSFESGGAKAIDTSDLSLCGYGYVINTVPKMLIDEKALYTSASDAMLFDLATSPCGIDFEAAKRLGLNAYLLSGVPGKCSPSAAAKVIADEIEAIIKWNDLL